MAELSSRPLLAPEADHPYDTDERELNVPSGDETEPLLYQRPPSDGSLKTSLFSVLIGSVMGALVCLTNIHFGMQTGYVNIMQMQFALVGFTVLNVLSKHMRLPFGRRDNILFQTVSSAIGAMPAAAGLLGVIPAPEYLIDRPIHLSFLKLCIWSSGSRSSGCCLAPC